MTTNPPAPPPLLRLDWSCAEAAENLAADEALLDLCEQEGHAGFLRFWEATSHFAALGFGKRLSEEVFETECAARGIPVLRRCSGGGTVLQGPGCLNYALALPISRFAELETITGANRFIMERNRRVLEALLAEPVAVEGHTDLAAGGVKFSGNAQRRKRSALLFHGSLLIEFDLALISKTLRAPAQQPEYRQRREHARFVRNTGLDRSRVMGALAEAWEARGDAAEKLRAVITTRARRLALEKYSRDEWNRSAISSANS